MGGKNIFFQRLTLFFNILVRDTGGTKHWKDFVHEVYGAQLSLRDKINMNMLQMHISVELQYI